MEENQIDVSDFILRCFKKFINETDKTEQSYIEINRHMFIQMFDKIVLTTLEMWETSKTSKKDAD